MFERCHELEVVDLVPARWTAAQDLLLWHLVSWHTSVASYCTSSSFAHCTSSSSPQSSSARLDCSTRSAAKALGQLASFCCIMLHVFFCITVFFCPLHCSTRMLLWHLVTFFLLLPGSSFPCYCSPTSCWLHAMHLLLLWHSQLLCP